MSASNETSQASPGSTEDELIAVRREKLGRLRELGVDPYGARFETDTTPDSIVVRSASMASRRNSGSSSRKSTPRWARVISPG